MRRIALTTFLGLGLAFSASSAGAVTLTLNATVNSSRVLPLAFTDFQVVFEDTGDGLFQPSELLSFSGVTLGRRDRNEGVFHEKLSGVPTLPGISVGNFPNWSFDSTSGNQGTGVVNDAWTYEINAVSTPEHSAVLGFVLVGGFLLKRKKLKN